MARMRGVEYFEYVLMRLESIGTTSPEHHDVLHETRRRLKEAQKKEIQDLKHLAKYGDSEARKKLADVYNVYVEVVVAKPVKAPLRVNA